MHLGLKGLSAGKFPYLVEEPAGARSTAVESDANLREFSDVFEIQPNEVDAASFEPSLVFVERELGRRALGAEHCQADFRVGAGVLHISRVHGQFVRHVCNGTEVFDVTSVGQCLSTWSRNSIFHPPYTMFWLRQMHRTTYLAVVIACSYEPGWVQKKYEQGLKHSIM